MAEIRSHPTGVSVSRPVPESATSDAEADPLAGGGASCLVAAVNFAAVKADAARRRTAFEAEADRTGPTGRRLAAAG